MVSTVGHDDDLLARFAGGDPEAFVAFYRRHLSAVLGFFLRRTGDPELTADLTAEVFAAALLAAERYRPGERPALAWLYGIAAHKLADSRRRGRVEDEARRQLALAPLTIDDDELARVEEMADPGAAQTALSALPPAQRDAVLARVVDERPYAEIAAAMRCSELLVRQRVSRGLRALRAQIKEAR
jgi:RNA polymerase sigma-70 factor (ECF subfamily)